MRQHQVPLAFATLIAAVFVASCGGKYAKAPPRTTTVDETNPAAAPSVLRSSAETVTFTQVELAVGRVYRRRPGIRTFIVRDVEYTPTTRNKVLDICHRGGLELNLAAVESSRIAGCAPLIFFFFNYGRQKNAPDAVAAARKIYWYAVENINGPFDARATLDALLRTWAVS